MSGCTAEYRFQLQLERQRVRQAERAAHRLRQQRLEQHAEAASSSDGGSQGVSTRANGGTDAEDVTAQQGRLLQNDTIVFGLGQALTEEAAAAARPLEEDAAAAAPPPGGGKRAREVARPPPAALEGVAVPAGEARGRGRHVGGGRDVGARARRGADAAQPGSLSTADSPAPRATARSATGPPYVGDDDGPLWAAAAPTPLGRRRLRRRPAVRRRRRRPALGGGGAGPPPRATARSAAPARRTSATTTARSGGGGAGPSGDRALGGAGPPYVGDDDGPLWAAAAPPTRSGDRALGGAGPPYVGGDDSLWAVKRSDYDKLPPRSACSSSRRAPWARCARQRASLRPGTRETLRSRSPPHSSRSRRRRRWGQRLRHNDGTGHYDASSAARERNARFWRHNSTPLADQRRQHGGGEWRIAGIATLLLTRAAEDVIPIRFSHLGTLTPLMVKVWTRAEASRDMLILSHMGEGGERDQLLYGYLDSITHVPAADATTPLDRLTSAVASVLPGASDARDARARELLSGWSFATRVVSGHTRNVFFCPEGTEYKSRPEIAKKLNVGKLPSGSGCSARNKDAGGLFEVATLEKFTPLSEL